LPFQSDFPQISQRLRGCSILNKACREFYGPLSDTNGMPERNCLIIAYSETCQRLLLLTFSKA
jgi:hypothetical protein